MDVFRLSRFEKKFYIDALFANTNKLLENSIQFAFSVPFSAMCLYLSIIINIFSIMVILRVYRTKHMNNILYTRFLIINKRQFEGLSYCLLPSYTKGGSPTHQQTIVVTFHSNGGRLSVGRTEHIAINHNLTII